MPFTDTFTTHVLASQKGGGGAAGLGWAVPAAMPPPAARRFWRASPGGGHSLPLVLPSQGQLYPGKGTQGLLTPELTVLRKERALLVGREDASLRLLACV